MSKKKYFFAALALILILITLKAAAASGAASGSNLSINFTSTVGALGNASDSTYNVWVIFGENFAGNTSSTSNNLHFGWLQTWETSWAVLSGPQVIIDEPVTDTPSTGGVAGSGPTYTGPEFININPSGKSFIHASNYTPHPLHSVNFWVYLKDPTGYEEVLFNYTTDEAQSWNTKIMNYDAQQKWFSTTFAGQPTNTTMLYKVTAARNGFKVQTPPTYDLIEWKDRTPKVQQQFSFDFLLNPFRQAFDALSFSNFNLAGSVETQNLDYNINLSGLFWAILIGLPLTIALLAIPWTRAVILALLSIFMGVFGSLFSLAISIAINQALRSKKIVLTLLAITALGIGYLAYKWWFA